MGPFGLLMLCICCARFGPGSTHAGLRWVGGDGRDATETRVRAGPPGTLGQVQCGLCRSGPTAPSGSGDVPDPDRRRVYVEPEPEPEGLTVGSYATSWLADRCERDPHDPQALRPSSVNDYQLLLANHIIPGLGRIPLSELKAPRSKPGTASSVPAAPPGRERRRTACCGRS